MSLPNNPFSSENIAANNWQLIDGEKVSDKVTLDADVVIVGTGAGGGIAAEILSKAGFKVVMVEEGPLRHSDHFDMKEKTAYPDLYQESAARKTKDKAISVMQGRAVGGSTTVNWTSSFRTPAQTLKQWQTHHGVEGITEESMKPWFEWVEQRLNINPWPVPPNMNNEILRQGATQLGWSSGVIARNVNGCANLGYCGTGCPINAKQSMLVTTIPAALNHGATLMSRTRVEKILVQNDKATGVEVKFIDHNGQIRNGITGTIKAKHVVMSAGAIGTPAVLLRSQIADPNSLIGKRTMIHPVNLTLGLFGEKVEGFSGAPQSIYSDEFQWRDQSIGYKLEVPPMHPVLSSIMVNGFGEEHAKVMEQLPHINAVLALVRDGFHEESQGGSIELDKHGYPVLDYPLTPILWKTFKESFANMMELQFAAGAKQVMPMHRDAGFINSWSEAKKALETLPMKPLRAKLFTAHLMGGCAMGEDKSQSVVNSYHQHHHVEGLSVMDASVFPTSLGVNPQLSIYGLTARAATHLVESLKG